MLHVETEGWQYDATTSTKSSTLTVDEKQVHIFELEMKGKITSWVKDVGFRYVKFLHKKSLYNSESKYFNECMRVCYNGFDKLDRASKDMVWKDYGILSKNKVVYTTT